MSNAQSEMVSGTNGSPPPTNGTGASPEADTIRLDDGQPPTLEQARPRTVADIKHGAQDSANAEIQRVFYKFKDYAVFLSANEVRIQYSDVDNMKKEQIGKVAELIPLRQRLQYLASEPSLGARYIPQIADALFLALQDRKDCGKQVLDDALKDIQEVRARAGRITYLKCAVGLGIGLSVPLFMFGQGAFQKAQVLPLLTAAGAGSIGALLSIAIALRGRTVATDGDWQTNMVDVTIRILIGVISAAVLFLLFSSGIFPSLQIGEGKVSATTITWQIALVIGFMAGFVERLLPDLLEKRSATPNKQGGQEAAAKSPTATG
jgi:hypothetical protein